MRISWPRVECVTCERLVGDPTRNDTKSKRLCYFKSSERYLLFPHKATCVHMCVCRRAQSVLFLIGCATTTSTKVTAMIRPLMQTTRLQNVWSRRIAG